MEKVEDSPVENISDGRKVMHRSVSPYMEERENILRNNQRVELLRKKLKPKKRECSLCAERMPRTFFRKLACEHSICISCLRQHIEISINENRVEVSCPECVAFIHPSEIALLFVDNPSLVEKYERFSLRKYLLAEPDARWCPGLDCGYAMIASNCATCPRLQCQREECGIEFCYHCKKPWHENLTCLEAHRVQENEKRNQATEPLISETVKEWKQSKGSKAKKSEMKFCPRCRTVVVKESDGTCNHMSCTMCNAEFCWLCLKEITDIHYMGPTGCTFWGKTRWTRKKKILMQIGTFIVAPVGIAVIAGLSIPGVIIGFPIFVGKRVHERLKNKSKAKRNVLTTSWVAGAVAISPLIATATVVIGIPVMLGYTYVIIPYTMFKEGTLFAGSSEVAPEIVVTPAN